MFNTIKVNNTDTNYTHSIFDISDYNSGATYTDLSAALAAVPQEKLKGGMSIKFVTPDTPARYSVVKTENLETEPTGILLSEAPAIDSGTYDESWLTGVFTTLPSETGVGNALTYYVAVTVGETTTYTSWVVTKVLNSENKYVQYRLIADTFSTTESDWQGVTNEAISGSKDIITSEGVEKEIVKSLVKCHVGPSGLIFNNNSLSIRQKVIPCKKYYIDTKYYILSLYYVFTDTDGNYVGTRKDNRTASKHIEEAPAGSCYLFVCVSYLGNGNVDVSDIGEYFNYIGQVNTVIPGIEDDIRHFKREIVTTIDLSLPLSGYYQPIIGNVKPAITSSNSLKTKDITVLGGQSYRVNCSLGGSAMYQVIFWNNSNICIGDINQGDNAEHTEFVIVPDSAVLMSVCSKTEYSWSVLLIEYEYYDFEKLNSDVEAITEDIVSKNIYDYNTVGIVAGLIDTAGKITQYYNGFCTGLIPIKPNHYYYITRKSKANRAIRCLDSNKSTIMKVLAPSNSIEYQNYYLPNSDGSGGVVSGQFKTPANAAYLQMSITNLNVTTITDEYKIMLEDVGDSYNPNFAPSSYEPYTTGLTVVKNNAIIKDDEPKEDSKLPIESGAVYDALNSIKIGKKLSVLLIGSSHGVNTISMFPVLAKHAGINILCGNLYSGSATIGFYTGRPAVQIPFMAQINADFGRFAVYENGEWTTKSSKTIKYALDTYKWDAIILQRGASENRIWNDDEANYFQNLLDYIKDNCDYNPRIYFNSGIANANNTSDASEQISMTEQITNSAKKMQSEFGINIIPTAIAVQYARATYLHTIGVYTDMASDTQHLDTGVGQYVTGCTVFEKIVKDFFNLSIRELDYLPVYSDVSGNVVNSGTEYFTAITNYYSRIGKTVAALAVLDGEYKSDTATMLNSRYGSLPTSYTITNNLTGCSNINDSTTIKSDEVYMTRLDVDSGKTMQSVVVTMEGVDITSDVYVKSYTQSGVTYEYNAIRIGEITGNIVITAVAS